MSSRPKIPSHVGLLALLWPSCILALIALLPRAISAPSGASLIPVALVAAVACAPMLFAACAVRAAPLAHARER